MTILSRKEIDKKYKWKIEDIYLSNEDLEKSYYDVYESFKNISKFKGTLKKSSENLLNCIQQYFKINMEIDKIYVYCHMKFHEDSTVSQSQILLNKSETLLTEFNTISSFIIPEIISIPNNTIDKFLNENEQLKLYTHFIKNIQRQKNHILSEEEEKIMSNFSEILYSSKNIFTMLNDADMKFDSIYDETGKKLILTKGNYISYLENKSRILRKNAFKTFYKPYIEHKNTIASTYYNNIKSDVIISNIRGYSSSLEYFLSDDNIPISVYDNLINTVNENLHLLHRYIKLRKKILDLDEIHMYDLYVPLTQNFDIEINYEKAKSIVIDGLKPLGNDYIEILKKAFENGWIDVYENKGKRSGAYSWGTYCVHPYILLNHQNNINSTFTLAHEMGHALHSYYSWKKQPYVYSGHKIFVAEVASTCNEVLLIKHIINTTEDTEFKKYIINYFLEQFRGTFFRQTMFAEFEKIAHNNVEKSEPLTSENLSKIYRNLNRKYFGQDIIIDDEIDIEWARIPHFYNSYYVYQYATGYSAAISLAEKILSQDDNALIKYKEFLSSGNSKYSIELLKDAGVDMTKSKPIENALKLFENLLSDIENLFYL